MEGLDLAVFGAHTHDRVFGRWHGPADEFVVAIGVVEVFEEVDGRHRVGAGETQQVSSAREHRCFGAIHAPVAEVMALPIDEVRVTAGLADPVFKDPAIPLGECRCGAWPPHD